ncbi:MAG: metal-dependent transcriptional regulator [Ruminococcaceae bacterium]|nr:metal-dependent transcriptional regulator [Oscillospiraceae bacterium]
MVLRKSAEDYLEAIYVLKQKHGAVRSIDVAHHLDYSKPSVSRAVGNLKNDGYLEMMEDGELVLTDKGAAAARDVYERHTILTALFTALGVSGKTAVEDACNVEHAISAETFACLKAAYHDNLFELMTPQGDDADKKKKKKKKKG